jgi:hypothetical protein
MGRVKSRYLKQCAPRHQCPVKKCAAIIGFPGSTAPMLERNGGFVRKYKGYGGSSPSQIRSVKPTLAEGNKYDTKIAMSIVETARVT